MVLGTSVHVGHHGVRRQQRPEGVNFTTVCFLVLSKVYPFIACTTSYRFYLSLSRQTLQVVTSPDVGPGLVSTPDIINSKT